MAFGFASWTSSIEGRAVASRVDLSWGEDGPDPERPWAITLSVPYRAGDDGLPAASERARLAAAEVEVEGAAWRAGRAVFVGARATEARLSLLFYAIASEPGRAELRRVAAAVLPHATLQFDDDPAWDRYRVFYPPPVVMADLRNRGQLERMARLGDPLGRPRPVAHHLSFVRRAGADAARHDAVRLGLAGRAAPGPAERPHSVVIRHDVALDEHFLGVATWLFGLAELHGGVYDGWEAERRTG